MLIGCGNNTEIRKLPAVNAKALHSRLPEKRFLAAAEPAAAAELGGALPTELHKRRERFKRVLRSRLGDVYHSSIFNLPLSDQGWTDDLHSMLVE